MPRSKKAEPKPAKGTKADGGSSAKRSKKSDGPTDTSPTPNLDPDLSPVGSARLAGSGSLAPAVWVDRVRPLVAQYMPKSDAAPPPQVGILLGVDMEVGSLLRLEYAVSNVGSAILIASQASWQLGGRGAIIVQPDLFLAQLRLLIGTAIRQIDQYRSNLASRSARVDAKTILLEINQWAQAAQLHRSGRPASAPLGVPVQVVLLAKKLIQVGLRLRLHEEEDQALKAPEVPRKTRKKRGAPLRFAAAADGKLVSDWKQSGVSKVEFERRRGSPAGSIQQAQDRMKARARRAKSKS